MFSVDSYCNRNMASEEDPASTKALERAQLQHRKLFLSGLGQIAVVSVLAAVYVPKHWEIFLTAFLITFVSNYLVSVLSVKKRSGFIKLMCVLLLDGAVVFALFWNLFYYHSEFGFMLFEFFAIELALFFISLTTSIIIQALVGAGGRPDKTPKVPKCLKYTVWSIIWFFHLFVFFILYLHRTVRY